MLEFNLRELIHSRLFVDALSNSLKNIFSGLLVFLKGLLFGQGLKIKDFVEKKNEIF